ncbi:MAG: hypothetical protein O7C75_07195 [Verrucomicrobia bacterium]|nr:hypothetical protein [Verrucomicrobiota bacterium]
MKQFSYTVVEKKIIFTLLVSFLSASISQGNPLIKVLYGEPGAVLNNVLEAVSRGENQLLLDSLFSEYLSEIHPEGFLWQLSNQGWKLDSYGFLSVTKLGGCSCFALASPGRLHR